MEKNLNNKNKAKGAAVIDQSVEHVGSSNMPAVPEVTFGSYSSSSLTIPRVKLEQMLVWGYPSCL